MKNKMKSKMNNKIKAVMTKNIVALSVAVAMFSAMPLSAQAESTIQPANVATAPAIPTATLQQLPWEPLVPPVTKTAMLNGSSAQLHVGDIQGAVGAFTLPADRGSLEITISSLVDAKKVYAPSVMVLDENMRPAAFYPSSYFSYQQPGVMSGDRLEGTLKLTPALGQKQIYLVIYTTSQDLAKTTQMVDPAKAYAAGVGNAVPNIPDPIAIHQSTGTIKIKVKAEQNTGNVMIGGILPMAPKEQPVVVGSSTPVSAPIAAPAKPAQPMLKDTDEYFNSGIRAAVKGGDIDKALKLMNEAEQLGSTTARETFIRSVKGKG
ncbi:Maltose operon periplasmic protein MalM [Enterobacteriaceae bacterium bta3-1]|nr:Maltose operon periplasmic protein MalM [Enterobacteriaceae bacterium bta3-1]